jgi:hypothetical protein
VLSVGSAVASLDTGSGPKPFGMTNVYLGMTKLPELAKRKEKSKQLSGAALFDLVGNMHL